MYSEKTVYLSSPPFPLPCIVIWTKEYVNLKSQNVDKFLYQNVGQSFASTEVLIDACFSKPVSLGPTMAIIGLKIFANLIGKIGVLYCFYLHFFNYEKCWASFHMLESDFHFFLNACLIFLIEWSLSYWFVRALCILRQLTLCGMNCKYFSTLCLFFPLFVIGFLRQYCFASIL